MNIAIVNMFTPFVHGGSEEKAESLQKKLIESGHKAAIIKIPLQWHPAAKILDHILAARLLQLENCDQVIGFKFPAFYVRHPNKVLWLCHQFRQAYDLWGTPFQDIPNTTEGKCIREI